MLPTIEILAPAGNFDMLHAAVLAGADAVYLGLEQFSARRTAGNFTMDTLRQAVSFCHARGVRVHVALNTVLYPTEVSEMAQAIACVAESGVDAVIAQDMAVVSLVRAMAPSLALHASTQMSVHTLEGARQLADMGVARVILSRELSLAEIANIAQNCGIETEAFVHGALCMSVSGQCYMSAFLGGRSGNRGACAGPCRLPFDAGAAQCAENSTKTAGFVAATGAHHLSLKDMSHIAMLPQLAAAGVCSVKIEGRLRTPEYAAAAVNACRQSLAGQPFDAALLQTVFSRSGFTDGYLAGRIDGDMFGMRTGEDAAAAREALPRLRELFRRENPRVAVTMQAHVEADGAKLSVADEDGNRAVTYSGANESAADDATDSAAQPQPAQKDQTENIQKALAKTGGTPFYLKQPAAVDDGTWFLPASEWNEMRRAALEALLKKRSIVQQQPCLSPSAPQVTALLSEQIHVGVTNKKLFVQFETVSQIPALWAENTANFPDGVVLPLSEWQCVPEFLRAVTWLALPRWAAANDAERTVAAEVKRSAAQGFAGFFVQNLAHIRICHGLPMFGGFGLNVTNALAARAYAQLGLGAMTLSVEMTVDDMAAVAPNGAKTAALIYGHVPLLLTRACPLQNVRTCKNCTRQGELLDRKGKYFPVSCSAPAAAGVRTVYNPIPIYMGDKLRTMPVEIAFMQFTAETPEQVSAVLRCVRAQQPFEGEFTRGLYFKGTQ